MYKKKETKTAETRLLSLDQAADYLGIGKSLARAYLTKIKAGVKIGRRSLYDKVKIDQAISAGMD